MLDSMMFVRHNPSQWKEPSDFAFEPSPVWHDDDRLVADEMAKTYLRNILTKSKNQIDPLRNEVDRRRREVEGAKRVTQAIREGRDDRDEVEITKGIFVLEDKLYEVERKKAGVEMEISTITSAVGDVSAGARNHEFKQQTFKIPTNCDLCGERIWGLSAKGFDCMDCGYTCHSKCEMKVPADCPGEQSKEDRKRLKSERQEAARELQSMPLSSSSNDASEAATTGNVAELPANSTQRSVSNSMSTATNKSGGLSRSDTIGTLATLGSGLSARVHRSTSATSSQVELDGRPMETTSAPMPPPRPPRPTTQDASEIREQKARMLYPYQKNDEGEISVKEGMEVVVLEADGEY